MRGEVYLSMVLTRSLSGREHKFLCIVKRVCCVCVSVDVHRSFLVFSMMLFEEEQSLCFYG